MAAITLGNVDSGTTGGAPYLYNLRWTAPTSATATDTWVYVGTNNATACNLTIGSNDGPWITNEWIVQRIAGVGVGVEIAAIYGTPPAVLKRAERLLQSMLTKRQRRMYERFGFFDLPSPSQKHVAYRIPKSGLIVMFEHGIPTKRLCVYEKEGLPPADWLIAAKLLVEADESELIKVANHHPLQRHVPVNSRIDRLPLLLRAA